MDKDTLYEVVEKAKKYDELINFKREVEVRCSFCGKSQSAIQKIMAGPGVNICDECVVLCYEIIKNEGTDVNESYEQIKEYIEVD